MVVWQVEGSVTTAYVTSAQFFNKNVDETRPVLRKIIRVWLISVWLFLAKCIKFGCCTFHNVQNVRYRQAEVFLALSQPAECIFFRVINKHELQPTLRMFPDQLLASGAGQPSTSLRPICKFLRARRLVFRFQRSPARQTWSQFHSK